ncbi:MAG TPA: hypothetical protein PK878_12530 [bacterium]|nr:hypothetical protein [Candidatus Omnitrophota bacterium]HOJ61103.1 hypothetical protein [bacterium]HOL94050.1 hypothetical protein [bacterium]HXK96002.1 hypothetical protein [bacterium]
MKSKWVVWIMRAWFWVVLALPSGIDAHDLHGVVSASAVSTEVHEMALTMAEPASAADPVSGQGEYRFRLLVRRDILPPEALAVLERAHGGFAVDRREGKGEVYFALPGAGIIRLSPDCQTAELLPTPDELKRTNLHNTTIWYSENGSPRLVFPANDLGKVFTTSLEGELLSVLDAPSAETDFDETNVNDYFKQQGKFAPTDVEYLDHLYYITTGYSDLDYVLTARVSEPPLQAMWHDLVFGGKGTGLGQLQTGHGITVGMNGQRLDVADRPVAEIERYTRYGHHRGTIHLPEGSYPCDIDYLEDLALVPCLQGPVKDQGAPVYLLKGGEVVSTIRPKEELGLDRFQHVHNAVLTRYQGKLYIVLQAWNPGDFAVLEQVGD